MTKVSRNTSKIPKRPCVAGFFSSLQAWAIDAEPMPASFVKTPRASPSLTDFDNKKPRRPPPAALKLKADEKIVLNAEGRAVILANITASDIRIYTVESIGIIAAQAEEIRFIPPKITMETKRNITVPENNFGIPKASSSTADAEFD